MEHDRSDSETMAHASLRAPALFFGNLNNELPKLQVASMLLQLTRQCTGHALEIKDLKIRFSQPSNCFTATLKMPTPDEQHKALTQISQCDQVPDGLVKMGRTLKVDYYLKPNRRKREKVPFQDGPDDDLLLIKGQHLGAETRILEFKAMAQLNMQWLRKTVSRYLCAFLNSSGGSLMLGVDDRGNVQGTPLTHKQEDEVRLAIDQIIKFFDPPVLPQMYSVLFIPVQCQDDTSRTQDDTTLKVIKLVVSPGRPNTLYATQAGDVFIRRDGSVQGPLKPREIQEWCHMTFDSKEKAYQQEISDLQAKLRLAEYSRQSISSEQSLKKTKSAVCNIL